MDETLTEENLPPVDIIPEEAQEAESKRNLQDGIRKRLAAQAAAHQKKLDEAVARAEAAEAKAAELQSLHEQSQKQQMIPVDAIPMIMEQQQQEAQKNSRVQKMVQKVKEASEQDNELKELIASKGHLLSQDDISLMGKFETIPNMPAIMKRLLKDPADYEIFSSAPNDYEKGRYLRELSEKIDNRNPERSSKKFEPAEKLTGSGVSPTDYSEYVDKYKGKKRR